MIKTSLLFISLILQNPESKPAPNSTEGAVTPVKARAKEIMDLCKADSKLPDALFTKEFLQKVPPAQIVGILHSLAISPSPVLTPVSVENNYSGKFTIKFETGMEIPLTIGVEPDPPHLIHSLWFGAPRTELKTFDDATARFAVLPGKISFGVAKLPADPNASVEMVASLEPDLELGIGSAFKLYILGTLIDDIEKGKRKWTDVTTIKKEHQSFPSGFLHSWHPDSPMTLHTLATLMISQSDNTATDHLLFVLGRERVEEMVTKMGNTHAARNVPFLSTLELFKLKGGQQKELRKRYISGDAAARRAILTKEVAAIDKKDVDLSGFAVKPVAIDSLEWYASPADLARTMRWLLDHTKTPESALGRGVLSVNLGLDINRDKFGFVGFKGGSETGVINLTHVFETKTGDRYVTAATWNNPKARVDDTAFVAIVQGVIEILVKRVGG